MPIFSSTAYVSVETVTLLMRAIANDMIYSQAGEILTDTANFMFPLLNDSLEWFTNEVNNFGIETFTKETFLRDIGPADFTPANDPGQQINISDTGYFDGNSSFNTPVVPSDLLVPLRMWERQSDSTENWVPMRQVLDGMPSQTPGDRFRMWEWMTDQLNMPGATQSNELRIRYTGSQGMLATPDDILLFRGATGPLAYKTVSTYLASKNPQAASAAASEAMQRVAQLATRSSRMKQRSGISRVGYGNAQGNYHFYPPRNT